MICKHIKMHYKYVQNMRHFLMKGAAAAVVERSMWHRIPLLRTTRSNWSNCARLLKILNKYLSNILQMLYKYFAISQEIHITNMLQVKLLALWHRIPLLGRHLIQLHHTTRPLQLYIICICIFFLIFICTLILFCICICLYNCPTLQTKMSQGLLQPNS